MYYYMAQYITRIYNKKYEYIIKHSPYITAGLSISSSTFFLILCNRDIKSSSKLSSFIQQLIINSPLQHYSIIKIYLI